MTDDERLLDQHSTEIRKLLERSLNLCSSERDSDTPDFVLADFLVGCLRAFNNAVRRRREWWGDKECSGFDERTGAPWREQDVDDDLIARAIKAADCKIEDCVYCRDVAIRLDAIQCARAAGKGEG